MTGFKDVEFQSWIPAIELHAVGSGKGQKREVLWCRVGFFCLLPVTTVYSMCEILGRTALFSILRFCRAPHFLF